MEIDKAIEKYFTREKIIENICRYQLYYQIGLGSVAYESIQDIKETLTKLDQINLHIDSQKVFVAIYEIIFHLSSKENFENNFDRYLKTTALTQMVTDFIASDKELINPKPYEDMLIEKIKEDNFFTQQMQEQFDLDYDAILPSWKTTITEEIAQDIKNSILEMYNKGIY